MPASRAYIQDTNAWPSPGIYLKLLKGKRLKSVKFNSPASLLCHQAAKNIDICAFTYTLR